MASAYDAINRANAVLDNVPAIDMDATLRGRILAEAKFLRALHYFNLVRMWGGVPLKLHETVGLDSLAIPRNTAQADVLGSILGEAGVKLDAVLEFDVPEDVVGVAALLDGAAADRGRADTGDADA